MTILTHLMLNSRILPLCVLTDEDSIDIIIRGFESLNRQARSDIREQIECSSKGQIQWYVALSNYASPKLSPEK